MGNLRKKRSENDHQIKGQYLYRIIKRGENPAATAQNIVSEKSGDQSNPPSRSAHFLKGGRQSEKRVHARSWGMKDAPVKNYWTIFPFREGIIRQSPGSGKKKVRSEKKMSHWRIM